MRLFVFILMLTFATNNLLDAQEGVQQTTIQTSTPLSVIQSNDYESDTKNPETVALALLETITGAKGEKIDTVRLANLFLPNAQMGLVREKNGQSKVQQFTAKGFVRRSPKMYEPIDFYETQIGITVNEFGNIAQVFQAYKTKGAKNAKGINSYQMLKENDQWRIIALIFQDETATLTIPKQFLD